MIQQKKNKPSKIRKQTAQGKDKKGTGKKERNNLYLQMKWLLDTIDPLLSVIRVIKLWKINI